MTDSMSISTLSILCTCIFICSVQCTIPGGPVFVKPSTNHIQVEPTQNNDAYVTQTVYGFLDFTTTIGNTVMVFSPQSAAAETTQNVIQQPNTVIETKSTTQPPPQTIKPSKTVTGNTNQKSSNPPKIVPIVQVQAQPPITSSKVQVVEQTVLQKSPQIFSSKVEIVSATVETPKIQSKVQVLAGPSSEVITKKDIKTNSVVIPSIISSVVEVKSSDEEPVIIGNNIGEVEYDLLSKQPSEVVEETYKIINLKPSSKFHLKPRPASGQTKSSSQKRGGSAHPTGLVTKLGGTVVKDGSTTIHETSVIGTYISGKYAQVLQSTSHIVVNHGKPKINASPTLRILKTAAPAIGKGHKHHHLEPTTAGSFHEESALPADSSNNLIKSTRRISLSVEPNFKPRFRNRKEHDVEEKEEIPIQQHGNQKKNHKIRPSQSSTRAFSEQQTSTPGRRFQTSKRHKNRSSNTINTSPDSSSSYTRRGYKSRIQSTLVDSSPSASTSLYKFKLNRTPGRWQYKTTQKPRVAIRKQNDNSDLETSSTTAPLNDVSQSSNDIASPQARSDEIDLNPLGTEHLSANLNEDNKLDQLYPLETIKVEISTPADFKNVYYELATIKSPYTFQVGSVKNTRYITVTSTFEKTLEPTETSEILQTEPLTENILATTARYDKDNVLDSGIATLPPIFLSSDMPTPPLETLTETFSTTQDMLKTHILPVVYGNETSSYTLTQTYHITRFVTATKTLPPMELYQFVPSKNLKDFNSHLDEAGSELHLELEFGDDNDEDGESRPRKAFLPQDLNLANIGSDFDLSDVDKSKIAEGRLRLKKNQFPDLSKPLHVEPSVNLSPEQVQQLAILRLLNPAAAAQVQIITTSKPVIKLETVFESHVIPIFNGVITTLSTLSKPVATVTRTEFEYGTSTIPALPVPPIPPVNPLFPQQPQFTITSTPVVTQTIVTETDSKVLKLTFGAKTAYTTILSTRVVPTLLTTYLTSSIAVQPSVPAFGGYYPGPFGAFPFVG